ncbi:MULTISPECIES: universal stress protein [unclassified Natrinema]|uniref:universal stress protein n=1 Tax=unclassified Natrinema TaxID=2622230 RepID=UPI00026D4963|nr:MULTISPECIES: universal stress protein [unclassified Natrinema]AFO57057.1 UspA domain-containing protein [Natrinema sp. J7-2]
MYDTILAATDGSDAANRAIDHAIDLASSFDADFHAIYVVDTTRYGQAILSESDGALDDLEERGEEILDDVAARSDIDVTSEIRRGRPDEEIDAYAAAIEADLVVLGNRGLGSGPAQQLGSIAERVVRNTGRPVITA